MSPNLNTLVYIFIKIGYYKSQHIYELVVKFIFVYLNFLKVVRKIV